MDIDPAFELFEGDMPEELEEELDQGLTDDDLLHITTTYINEAENFIDEKVSGERAQALDYYNGKNPYTLPLEDGRSQMVSTDVRDVIEWIMPSLLEIFTSGDKYMSIEGTGGEDVDNADTVEAWVNYVLQRMNPGFLVFHDWIKDALLQKVGFVKAYWHEDLKAKREDYNNISPQDLLMLQMDPDYLLQEEIIEEHTQANPLDPINPIISETISVRGKRISRKWKLCVENVPPEETLVLEQAKSIPHQTGGFIGCKMRKTIGELRAMGYDVDDDLQGPEIEGDQRYSDEEIARRDDTAGYDDFEQPSELSAVDPTLRKVWLYELFVLCDVDGDGLQEWVRLHRVGDEILSQVEVKYPMMFGLCPIRMPHRLFGKSMADLVVDLQELMTALNRQILDHVYLTNDPKKEVDVTGCTPDTIDDILDSPVGGIIRVKKPGTVNPLSPEPLQPWTFDLLEHWEQRKENRTGVTRMNQGTNDNALHDTALGVAEIMSAAQQRIKMIARIFAETGFADLAMGIIDLSQEYPDQVGDRVIRLTGKPINMDPSMLDGEYDLVVDAGIGGGNLAQQAQGLQQLMATYERLAGAGMGPGTERAMVTTKNIFNAVRESVKLMGFRNTGDFITDPSDESAERDPVQPPQPSAEMKLAEAEMAKAQANMMDSEKDHEWHMAQINKDFQIKMADIALEREKLQRKDKELELKERELKMKETQAGFDMNVKATESARRTVRGGK